MSKNKTEKKDTHEKEETAFHGSVSITKISPDDKEAKRRMRMVELLSAIAVIAVLSVGITLTIIGSFCQKPVKSFFESMATGDVKQFEASIGDDITASIDEHLKEISYYEFYSELLNINNIDEFIGFRVNELNKDAKGKYGDDLEISVSFRKKNKLSKSELKAIEDDLVSGGITNISFSKGYVFDIKVSYKGSLLKESENLRINVVKNNDQWMCPDVVTNYL